MMKIKQILSPIKTYDYVTLLILTFINMLYCLIQILIVLFIALIAMELLEPYILNSDERNNVATWIAKWLPMVVLSLLAGALINKLRVWLLSLPIQYCLYWAVSYFAPAIPFLSPVYDAFGTASVVACATFAGRLLLIQIPGVAVSLLIRSLIRLIIRKIRSRKQPVPTE